MIINKPSVFIYTVRPDRDILREVRAGLEEEGVFCEITEKDEMELGTLAFSAAEESMLGCGIGIYESNVVLTMKGLGAERNIEKLSYPTKGQSRNLGANAARVIKKQPLKE